MALEYREHDELIVQAELPGLNPERDLEVWISHAVLHIRARGGPRGEGHALGSDLRDGQLARDIALPANAGDEARATYLDGRLEVRVPLGRGGTMPSGRVPVRDQRSS